MSCRARRQPLLDLNASRQMEAQNGKKFNTLVNDTLSRLENLQSLLNKPKSTTKDQNRAEIQQLSEDFENIIQLGNKPKKHSESPAPKNQPINETQRSSETSDQSPDKDDTENMKRKAKKARRNAKRKEQRLSCGAEETNLTDENSTPPRDDRIKIDSYKDESQIGVIMELIGKELSEPYSIYTYRYFINTWPELTLIAYDTQLKKYVGVIVCKVDSPKIEAAEGNNEEEEISSKGYIAMLAVDESHRGHGIGTKLVEEVISRMHKMSCDEIILETEISNTKALNLYSRLGFIRERRLFRYYLNGSDAFRLVSYRS